MPPTGESTGQKLQYPTEDDRPLWKKIASALLVDLPTGALGIGGESLDKPWEERDVSDIASGIGQVAGVFPPGLIAARRALNPKIIEQFVKEFSAIQAKQAIEAARPEMNVAALTHPRAFSRIGGIHLTPPEEFASGRYHPSFLKKNMITEQNRGISNPEELLPTGTIELNPSHPENLSKTFWHEFAHSADFKNNEGYTGLRKHMYLLHPDEIAARTIANRKTAVIPRVRGDRSYLQDYLKEANATLNSATPEEVQAFIQRGGLHEMNDRFAYDLAKSGRTFVVKKPERMGMPYQLDIVPLKEAQKPGQYPPSTVFGSRMERARNELSEQLDSLVK